MRKEFNKIQIILMNLKVVSEYRLSTARFQLIPSFRLFDQSTMRTGVIGSNFLNEN